MLTEVHYRTVVQRWHAYRGTLQNCSIEVACLQRYTTELLYRGGMLTEVHYRTVVQKWHAYRGTLQNCSIEVACLQRYTTEL